MAIALKTRVIQAGAEAAGIAARCLEAGGLVAFPTETVYGLGADATQGEAVARLYEAKGRPAFNPLIAHVADTAAACRIGQLDDAAERLAAAFWPGPLTLVLRKRAGCPVADLATAGLDTVAVRVPDHLFAQQLLAALGKPVVAPSANISGHVSPTTAQHVEADLSGRIDLIVDGGPTQVGVESTIVSCVAEPMVLRPGGLAREDIERVLRRPLASAPDVTEDTPLAPGMLASHYAPKARLRLDAADVRPGEGLLAFGTPLGHKANKARTILNLSSDGELIEAAANLFSHLRAFDALGIESVAVMPIPQDGLGEAINDRLRRAAAPR